MNFRTTLFASLVLLFAVVWTASAHGWPTFVSPIGQSGQTCRQTAADCGMNCQCAGWLETYNAGRTNEYTIRYVHTGLDLYSGPGWRINAPFSGTVREASWHKKYGATVIIEADDRSVSAIVAHLRCDDECTDTRSQTCRERIRCMSLPPTDRNHCEGPLPTYCSDPTIARCASISHNNSRTCPSLEALGVRASVRVNAGDQIGWVGIEDEQQNGNWGPHVRITLRRGPFVDAGNELEICAAKSITEYTIFSDSETAAARSRRRSCGMASPGSAAAPASGRSAGTRSATPSRPGSRWPACRSSRSRN